MSAILDRAGLRGRIPNSRGQDPERLARDVSATREHPPGIAALRDLHAGMRRQHERLPPYEVPCMVSSPRLAVGPEERLTSPARVEDADSQLGYALVEQLEPPRPLPGSLVDLGSRWCEAGGPQGK